MMAGFSNLQERLLKGSAKTSRLDYLVYILRIRKGETVLV